MSFRFIWRDNSPFLAKWKQKTCPTFSIVLKVHPTCYTPLQLRVPLGLLVTTIPAFNTFLLSLQKTFIKVVIRIDIISVRIVQIQKMDWSKTKRWKAVEQNPRVSVLTCCIWLVCDGGLQGGGIFIAPLFVLFLFRYLHQFFSFFPLFRFGLNCLLIVYLFRCFHH